MTIKELREWATISMELPLSDTLMLLSHVLSVRKEELFNDSVIVPQHTVSSFQSLVEKRLSGIPMAYLRNKKEFYGAQFYVDERVLIPRPETELIIDTVLDILKSDPLHENSETFLIADIGTGSGALALTLARVLPAATIHAVDVSSDALAVAQKNRASHGLDIRVQFHLGDLLNPFITTSIAPDIIVANLPYIAMNDVENVEPEVHAHEPHVALYSGQNGLEHYGRMLQQLEQLPRLPKYILGEFGAGQVEALKILIKNSKVPHTANLTIHNDLAGIPRVFLISLPR